VREVRHRIDPEERSVPAPPALAEAVARVRPLLPRPVAGTTTLIGGDPGEVIVRVTASAIEVMEFSVDWLGPHEPVTFGLPVASLALGADRAALVEAIAHARARRIARYRRCERCGRVQPPEWMMDDEDEQRCQECFERAGGVF